MILGAGSVLSFGSETRSQRVWLEKGHSMITG